jgi:hypothetical protein
MRNSDTNNPNSNIVIAFPGQQPKRLSASTGSSAKTGPCALSSGEADKIPKFRISGSRRHATMTYCSEIAGRLEILTTKGNPTPELIDKLAPGLVRNILRRVESGDCAKASLPKPLMRRLDLMCQFKHPAALIIQDWVDGKRAFLPTNLQTIADYSTCAVGGKVMSTISKRVSKYLIARQKRAARLKAFGEALDAGILERHPTRCRPSTAGQSGNLTEGTAAHSCPVM